MNSIAERQNSPEAIDLLRASSYVYGLSKLYSTVQTVLAGVAALTGGICSLWFPHQTEISASVALVVIVLDLVLEQQKQSLQETGAKIQELFDTFVLQLPANPSKVRSVPSPEDLLQFATNYGTSDEIQQAIADWYPKEAMSVPIEFGRLICQRSNLVWDASLRNYVAAGYVAAAVILAVGAIIAGALLGWTVKDLLLLAVLPLSPALVKLLREGFQHAASARSANECQSILETIWAKAHVGGLSSNEAIEESRRLQDELYDRRRSAPTIPNPIYKHFRSQFEAQMQHAAGVLVARVNAAANNPRL